MAQCKNCLRKGALIHLDVIGVCEDCSFAVFENIDYHRRKITHFTELIESGESIKSVLRACAEATRHAVSLANYEIKRISTGDPPVGEIIEYCQRVQERVIDEHLSLIVKNGMDLASAAGISTKKTRALRTALVHVNCFYAEHDISCEHPVHRTKLLNALRDVRSKGKVEIGQISSV